MIEAQRAPILCGRFTPGDSHWKLHVDEDHLTIGPLTTMLVAALDPALGEHERRFPQALDLTRSRQPDE